ncbi:uncharacterized protein TNCV_1864471 [Trichonephila clavipes]|nr:uncharacterized protein TNCV_1864471 [Trichonephila clavipes]
MGSGVKHELEEKVTTFLRKIRVRDTQVRPISAGHLSDHHLTLGQNPVESSKCAGKRLLGINYRLTLGPEDQRGSRGSYIKIMAASSSSFIPIPLGHADNQGEGHLRGAPLQPDTRVASEGFLKTP